MIGSPTTDEDDPLRLDPSPEQRRREPLQRRPQGRRLVVDLLQHQRLKRARVGRLVGPVDLDDRPHPPPARPVELHLPRAREDDLVVLDVLDLRGLRAEGGRRGSQERPVGQPADHERTLAATPHEGPRMLAMATDEGEVAGQPADRRLRRLDEIAPVMVLEQVADDLRVRLGLEAVAVGGELGT